MFESRFSHFLSYGPSDQHTLRALRGEYGGLIVPGTVAAFQRQGTGGFVLSLSASESRTPYVIDPRSPLFQQFIQDPKKSHELLREVLGLPRDLRPLPESFDAGIVKAMAENWARFNCNYHSDVAEKFKKYAERLGDTEISREQASAPELVLAPYFVASSVEDPWWEVASVLAATTRSAVAALDKSRHTLRVVASASASALDALLQNAGSEDRVIVWVSDLNELKAPEIDLVAYGGAIRAAAARGQQVFALYGGFFAVLLASLGLRGASHGIGFGEYRSWRELPQSGPPPARYYLPETHCYVRPELADVLWGARVTACECSVCRSTPPILLEYHELMMHSVLCRSKEIRDWADLSPSASADRLEEETAEFLNRVGAASVEERPFKVDARRAAEHIPGWIAALRSY